MSLAGVTDRPQCPSHVVCHCRRDAGVGFARVDSASVERKLRARSVGLRAGKANLSHTTAGR